MAEPLAVDPTRLTAAASKLSELVFPAPPAPMQVAGTDAVSAAINETMPGIESLVSDGLPGVTAALRRTAGRMIAAADIYTKADQSLGQALSQDGFDGAAPTLGAMAAASGQTDAGTLGAATLGGPASAPGQLPGAAGGTAAVAGVGQQFAEAVSGQVAAVTPHLQATVPQPGSAGAPLGQQADPDGPAGGAERAAGRVASVAGRRFAGPAGQ